MAERTGLEPATPGVTGRYSNQLNYRSALKEIVLREAHRFGVAYCANCRLQSLLPSNTSNAELA
jgi:hypothetical protein